MCAPGLDADVIAALGLRQAVQYRETAADALLAMMHAQRCREWPLGSGSEITGYIVGGAAVLTTIDVTGISQRVIHRWPDEVGSFVKPEGIEEMAA